MISLRDKPIQQGLLAMLVVGGGVALMLGLIALVGARVAGFGGDGEPGAQSTVRETMYLPTPQATESGAPGPLISVAPQPGSQRPTQADEPRQEEITLRAGSEQAGAMQRIDLTGDYPGGDGAILLVQKQRGSAWEDFAGITANVSGGTFSTYIQTGTPGPNKFRVIDTDSGKTSNVVTITIG